MIKKKGVFATRGKAILGDKPSGLSDILDDQQSPSVPASSVESDEKTGNTENRKNGKPEYSHNDITDLRKTDNTEIHETSNTSIRKSVKLPSRKRLEELIDSPLTKREEFRLPGDLAERLRVYTFDTRSKKTAVVIEALDAFLRKKGY